LEEALTNEEEDEVDAPSEERAEGGVEGAGKKIGDVLGRAGGVGL
jgi:hypothetical protein